MCELQALETNVCRYTQSHSDLHIHYTVDETNSAAGSITAVWDHQDARDISILFFGASLADDKHFASFAIHSVFVSIVCINQLAACEIKHFASFEMFRFCLHFHMFMNCLTIWFPKARPRFHHAAGVWCCSGHELVGLLHGRWSVQPHCSEHEGAD